MSTEWGKKFWERYCLWTSTVANSQENLFFVDGSCRWQHRLRRIAGKQTVFLHPFWTLIHKNFLSYLLLRPRPYIFGVTSLWMMSLRLMKKVNFQNCHHSNMYNMYKMNLSLGHYSKLIQPNIQSQGNSFFHFETKYVRPVVCRIARTCVWNFQQMELAGFFNSICKRCLLRWSCQLLVKLLWHAVCIAETTVQFQTIKPFLKRFIAGINLRIW